MVHGIYTITHAPTGRVYVGSAVDVEARWRLHRRDLERGQNSPKLQRCWDQCQGEGFEFAVIERVEQVEDLLVREQHYLDALKPYFNIAQTAGSNLGIKFSAVTRQRMGDSRRGKKASETARQNISDALKGKPKSEAHKAKMLASRIGFKHTEAAKRKIGEAHLGRTRPPETGKRISEALKNKPKSEEHVRNISASRKGNRALHKMTDFDVFILRKLKDVFSYRQFASYFCVSCSTISNAMNGRTWPLDLQIDISSDQANTKILTMVESIVRHLNIPDGDPEIGVLAASTEPSRLVEQIVKVMEKEDRAGGDDGNEP